MLGLSVGYDQSSLGRHIEARDGAKVEPVGSAHPEVFGEGHSIRFEGPLAEVGPAAPSAAPGEEKEDSDRREKPRSTSPYHGKRLDLKRRTQSSRRSRYRTRAGAPLSVVVWP